MQKVLGLVHGYLLGKNTITLYAISTNSTVEEWKY